MIFKRVIDFCVLIILLASCNNPPGKNSISLDRKPTIYPDYTEITIPPNIAPLNFSVEEEGKSFFVDVHGDNGTALSFSSKNGIIHFPKNKWEKLIKKNSGKKLVYTIYIKKKGKWFKFDSFIQTVSDALVDPYLYYRLLYPGYESWKEISIVQRDLESFSEKTVVDNSVIDQNCVNCHSFNNQNPDDFLFHVRGSKGGTYFLDNGNLKKVNIRTERMKNGAVYSRWHPSGRFVAFSSNKVVQRFHSSHLKKIEVSDLNSTLVLYDVEKNETLDASPDNNGQFMDTYPEWSPDGKYLYFCRAAQIVEQYDYRDIKYDLYRMEFNPVTRKFSPVEPVFQASVQSKSASFPRISPDGGLLVFTLHNYGCFPIWHKEADLYFVNLDDFAVTQLPVNSDFTESYHSWSSNGRWLLFSSKRDDGLTARPFVAYIGPNGKAEKPFIVPQKDPLFYRRFIKTFNIPEFAISEISFTPDQLRKAAAGEPVQSKWVDNKINTEE